MPSNESSLNDKTDKSGHNDKCSMENLSGLKISAIHILSSNRSAQSLSQESGKSKNTSKEAVTIDEESDDENGVCVDLEPEDLETEPGWVAI